MFFFKFFKYIDVRDYIGDIYKEILVIKFIVIEIFLNIFYKLCFL